VYCVLALPLSVVGAIG
jgi:hypothetical protein